MTDSQWTDLLRVLGGELLDPLPGGIDYRQPLAARLGGREHPRLLHQRANLAGGQSPGGAAFRANPLPAGLLGRVRHVYLFNFSFNHSLPQMRVRAGDGVTLLGNIPPRDVFDQGTPEEVPERSVAEALADVADRRRIILSCGGGTPPGVSTENIEALCAAAG